MRHILLAQDRLQEAEAVDIARRDEMVAVPGSKLELTAGIQQASLRKGPPVLVAGGELDALGGAAARPLDRRLLGLLGLIFSEPPEVQKIEQVIVHRLTHFSCRNIFSEAYPARPVASAPLSLYRSAIGTKSSGIVYSLT